MQAWTESDEVWITLSRDEFLELHEELLFCTSDGPYMYELFSALCGVE